MRVQWICTVCGRVAEPTGGVDQWGEFERACPAHPEAELEPQAVPDER